MALNHYGWQLRGSSWVREYISKPAPKREPPLTPEDAAEIEQAAQHLAELGCTAEQIERHTQCLAARAARRAASAPKATTKQLRPPAFELTQDQIDALLPTLAERSWRWSTQPNNDAKRDWVGHPILSVPGVPVPDTKSNAAFLVGDVLAQLRALGLVKRVSVSGQRKGPHHVMTGWWVEVVTTQLSPAPQPQPTPRERLNSAQKRERLALTGIVGSGHTDVAAHVPAAF